MSEFLTAGLFENNIYLVLEGCNDSLCNLKKFTILKNSSFASCINVSIFSLLNKRVVSSANSKDKNLEQYGRSLIYRRKSIGPRTEPCGTPYLTLSKLLLQSPMETNCWQFVR
jgi:hypothetical protein